MNIGIDRIIDTADTHTIYASQIGATRIGTERRIGFETGCALPRTRRGTFASLHSIVETTIETIELVTLPRVQRAVAVMARRVVALALYVVSRPVTIALAHTVCHLLRGVSRVARSKTAFNLAILGGLVAFLVTHPISGTVIKELLHVW